MRARVERTADKALAIAYGRRAVRPVNSGPYLKREIISGLMIRLKDFVNNIFFRKIKLKFFLLHAS